MVAIAAMLRVGYTVVNVNPLYTPRELEHQLKDSGAEVAFEDRYLQTQVGTIVRINQRTATIDTGDGTSWRVGFGLLRHVFDI